MTTLIKYREMNADLNFIVTELILNTEPDEVTIDKFITRENTEYLGIISTDKIPVSDAIDIIESNSDHHGLIELNWPEVTKLMERDMFGMELGD